MQIGPYVPITQQNQYLIGSSSIYRAYNNNGERIMLNNYPQTASCEFLYTYDSFYSASTPIWYDLSGKNKHINGEINVPINEYEYGGGYSFDYAGDFSNNIPTGSIASASAYTVCMWFQGTNAADNIDGTLIGQGSSNWYIRRINTTSINRVIYDGSGTAITMDIGGDVNFLAVSVESGQVHMWYGYTGGSLIDYGTAAGTVYNYQSNATTFIGAGGVNYWNESIGSVGLWSGNLNNDEVTTIFNNFRRISL
jgi:hypothetical protein